MALATTLLRPPKRRILFIEKAFQLKFIAKVVVVVVLGTVLTGALMYLLADKEFGRAFYSAHYQARSSWELLLPVVLVSSFVAMCLVAVVAVVLTLYDSHRIGGPLYRFKANLEAIGQGDLTLETHLREGDELKALTATMNEMTAGLRRRVQAARAAQEELGTLLERCGGAADPAVALGAEELERLRRISQQLEGSLGEFRV